MTNELIYQLALKQLPSIGPVLAKNLISYCGGVEAIFSEKLHHLKKIPGIGEHLAKEVYYFNEFSELQKEIEFMENEGISSHFYTTKDYPFRLKQVYDAPILLFKKGNASIESNRMLAVIGTRQCSRQAKEQTAEIVEELGKYNPTIVSGLAYGVDAAAHKAAVECQIPTIAVLGHGFDRIYPSLNKPLAEKILEENGSWLTEFVHGTIPDRENFPKRNRIVAGMVDAVLVVETPNKGGSLITADLAFQYDREVMALPGRNTDVKSRGCNQLIKQQKAHLVETADDIASILNWDLVNKQSESQISLPIMLTSDEQIIFETLKLSGGLAIDSLAFKTKLPLSKLAFTLLELEFRNVVRCLPGKRYEVI